MTSIHIPDNHISMIAEKKLQGICQPLFKNTDINLFIHARIYADNTAIGFSSNATYQQTILKENIQVVPDMPANVNSPNFNFTPQNHSGNFAEALDYFRDMHNIGYPIYFVKMRPKYTDFFVFSGQPENHKLLSFYHSNTDLLERFLLYYYSSNQDLLKNTVKHRFLLSEVQLPLNFIRLPDLIHYDTSKKEKFIKDLELKHYVLCSNSGEDLIFSFREMQCLEQLFYGKTAKQIAEMLNLSRRTIESHILSIKQKIGVSTRSDIIEFIRNNDLHKIW